MKSGAAKNMAHAAQWFGDTVVRIPPDMSAVPHPAVSSHTNQEPTVLRGIISHNLLPGGQ